MPERNVIEFVIKGVYNGAKAFGQVTLALTRVGAAVKSVAAAVTKTFTAVAQWVRRGALAFAAAATSVFLFANRIATLEDRLAKLSIRLGTTADELSRLHFAAELGGIEVRTFDMALQRMSRRLGEAAKGTGEARVAFAQLGINARQLAQLPLSRQMEVIADSLANVTNKSDKLRLAFKLFDSEGVSVLQTMQRGSKTFKEAAADIERLGGVVTPQAAANAEVFQNQWLRLKTAIGGAARVIGDELIPLIAGMMKQTAEWVADSGPRIRELAKTIAHGFVISWLLAKQLGDKIVEVWNRGFDPDGVRRNLQSIVDVLKSFISWVVNVTVVGVKVIGKLIVLGFQAAFEVIVSLGKNAWERLKAVFTGESLGAEFAKNMIDDLHSRLEPLKQEAAEALTEIPKFLAESTKNAFEGLPDALGLDFEGAKAQAEAFADSIKLFGDVAKESTEDAEFHVLSFMDRVRAANAEFLATQRDTIDELAHGVLEISLQTADAIGNAFASVVVEGENLAKALQTVLKSVLAQLIALLVKTAVQRVITATIGVKSAAAEATANLASGIAQYGVNAAKSAAAIPVIGWQIAPAVGQAALVTGGVLAKSGLATGAALGASVGGVAHGGLDYVPRESTFLLDRGERVVSPEQNRDLTRFLNESTGGGTTVIENLSISILPNATSADALLKLSKDDMRRLVSDKIIGALDDLYRRGVSPEFAERRRRV